VSAWDTGRARVLRCLRRAIVLAVLLVPVAWAQSGGSFEMRRSTIDGGGGRSSGAAFELTGTIGQPDAGFASGGGFELRGGFWAAATPASSADTVFGDGFE
jgi:hypothetical protein